MNELQLQIGGRPVIKEEVDTLAKRYPLMDSAMYLCWMGLAFQEPIDDDDETANEADVSEEDEFEATSTGEDAQDNAQRSARSSVLPLHFVLSLKK